MDKSELLKRCVSAEGQNSDLNEGNITQLFPNVLKWKIVTKPTASSDGDDDQQWLLLFESQDVAESYYMKKRIETHDGSYVMLHSCSHPCDIPQDWLQEGRPHGSGDTLETDSSNQPPSYNDIYTGYQQVQGYPHGSHPHQFPPHGPYPGPGYQQHYGPGQPPPYNGNKSHPQDDGQERLQQDMPRPPSQQDMPRPQSYEGMHRIPSEQGLPGPTSQGMPRPPTPQGMHGPQTNPDNQYGAGPNPYQAGPNVYYGPPPHKEGATGSQQDIPGSYPMHYPGQPYPNYPGYPYPNYSGHPWPVGYPHYPGPPGSHPYPEKDGHHVEHPQNVYYQQHQTGMYYQGYPQPGPPTNQTNVKDPVETHVKAQVAIETEQSEMSSSRERETETMSTESDNEENQESSTASMEGIISNLPQWKSTDEDEKQETEDKKESIKMIKVSNIPAGSSEDALMYFFENKRKSGGGDIAELDYDTDSQTAIITFEEEDVVERVMNKNPLLFEKKIINVEIYKPETDDIEEDGQSTGDQEVTYQTSEIAIEVRGMKPRTTKDTIMYYFEGRKGANVDVIKMEYIEEKEMYMIWFEEEEAIETVLKKAPHKVEGNILEVKRYSPPPPPKPVPKYDDKVFITNISTVTTKDGLENFLEAKSKIATKEIIFGETEGSALVTFEEIPDIEKLQKVCTTRKLDGCHLKIHRVDITDCVVVSGFKADTSADLLENYFDNKRRSGVEGVREVEMKREEGQCLIYFSDPDSALEVCKREHKVAKDVLKVQVYYGCLGQAAEDDDGPKFKPLKPTILKNLDPRKIEFILHSKTNKMAFEKQLSNHNAAVEWPDLKEIKDTLEVSCTMTEEVKECRKLAKTWAKTVATEAEKFFAMLEVIQLEILQGEWDDVMKQLQDISIANTESVAIRVVKDQHLILVIGHKMPAEELAETVKCIVKNVGIENERKKLEVTEEVTLKTFQLLILIYLHFMDKMKKEFEKLDIIPNMKKKKMVFTGMSSSVNAAKVKMYEQLQQVMGASAGKFSEGYIQYLCTPEVKTFLGQAFKQKGVMGVWEVQDDNSIMMHSLSDEGVVTAITVLKESVKEVPMSLDKKQAALLNTKTWKDEVHAIEAEYSKALVQIKIIDPNNIAIYLVSLEDDGILMEKVNDIFFKHAKSEIQLKLPRAEMRLLQEHYQTEIDTMKTELMKNHVTLKLDNIAGICIEGNAKGVDEAKNKIDNIVKSIYRKKYTIEKAGIVKHMNSEQGRSRIITVEKRNKVVVELQQDRDSDDEEKDFTRQGPSRSSWTEIASCTTPTGQIITAVVGDITELKVDVIVNAANKELQHVGGLAKVIVDKGGQSIQVECDRYVQSRGKTKKMYEGEIFCGSPGNLDCKMIAHAVGPVWKGGHSTEEDYLCECVQASLERMDEKNYKSIAIPALCTGVFGYPSHKATKVIVEAIRDYVKDNKNSCIKQIYLCDVKNDLADLFVVALDKYYKGYVTKSRGRSSQVSGGSSDRRRHASPDDSFVHVPNPRRDPPTNHISITLVKGQIASQEVDVLVNTTSTSLQLNQGAVSQSLLKMGGPSIQTECTQKYPNGIQSGEIAVTSGGKLECKIVCHGALPGWNGGTATKIMENFMKECLKTASDKGFVSIAFPALGTGNLGYPKNVVARNMYLCVDKFSSSNPGTSICDVRFVVYERDIPTIKAFEEEQRKRQTGEFINRQSREFNSGAPGDHNTGRGATGGWQQEALGGNKQASVDIGDLTLKVYQGDITGAGVDVIVNGTNRDLDLTRGGVSQAILRKGGDELMKNLQLPSVKKEMKKDGVTVTRAGSRLSCEFIIHIDMEDTRLDLKSKFKEVIEKVEDLDQETVALPALGAGLSHSIETVAESLFEALVSLEKKKLEVKEVHVVIFQDDMLSKFLSSIEGCLQGSGMDKGFFGKVKGWMGYGNKNPVKGKQMRVTKMDKSSLNLTVYAKDQDSADIALRTLEENMATDYKEKVLNDVVLKELSDSQEAKIMKIKDTCEVEIDINKRIGRIKISGLPDNLSEALDEVHKLIRDLDRQKQKHQQAQLVKDMVQWYFISVEDTGQKLEEYPPEVNLILEQALRNNDGQAFFLDNNGNKYIVDFTNYEEYPEDDPSDTVAVLRKSKMSDSAFDMPSNWETMDQSENIKIVTLQPSDTEYVNVVQDFQTQMRGGFSTIVKVEKIQNRTLQQQYVAKKKLMESTNQSGHNNERKLWHGTAMDAVDSINTYGFNRSYCGKNAVAYGNGVYFAVNPTYSAQSQYARPDPNGNKRMYMCKVLVGEYTKGQGGMKVPPPKPGAAGSHILYDSVVDNPAGPGIFVIFHDTQAYPEYLIVFK